MSAYTVQTLKTCAGAAQGKIHRKSLSTVPSGTRAQVYTEIHIVLLTLYIARKNSQVWVKHSSIQIHLLLILLSETLPEQLHTGLHVEQSSLCSVPLNSSLQRVFTLFQTPFWTMFLNLPLGYCKLCFHWTFPRIGTALGKVYGLAALPIQTGW